ncbi:MAG TPA: isoprenylcysteine carboxylmethyltransferase family protein [Dongiaceae bacterium]|nr:isoprenylcysteine carboxylmethyltransferase family protein [Dongiaceae bacterium]
MSTTVQTILEMTVNWFLPLYFAAFFGVAVVWRTYRVWRDTGVNAFRLREESGPERVTGRYFKLLPVGVVVLLAVYWLWPAVYRQLGVIELLETAVVQSIGMLLMLAALVWTVLAQTQMGQSWRIGIDHEHRTALVTAGVYRFSRNPIFVGMIGSMLGLFLVLPCAVTLLVLGLSVALIQVQVSLEETHLRDLHGNDYGDYCHQVPRWL